MKIIFAGGGTGGHIYPALSIAESLQKLNPQVEVHFAGTSRGLETKIIPKAGYPLHLVQGGQLNFSGNIFKKIITLLKIPLGMIQAFILLKKIRPDFVLGVGGYASVPVTMVAALSGYKTALWEPNAHPGMANRFLSGLVPQAYLVFDKAKNYLKSKNQLVLGMPLRAEIEQAADVSTEITATEALAQYSKKIEILCFGGSQGSLFLNQVLSDFILSSPELYNNIHVVHQTGSADFSNVQKKYGEISCVEVKEYIYDMPVYLRQADILICRGGASTLAEAAAFGVVPIVIPLPAADNHQQKNAENLVAHQAGYMCLQNNFNKVEFKNLLLELMVHPDHRKKMSSNLKALAPRKASEKIAQHILSQTQV